MARWTLFWKLRPRPWRGARHCPRWRRHRSSTQASSALPKSPSTWLLHQGLVARMADAEAHAAVIVAAMGGDRAQAVMARIAAADLHPQLGRAAGRARRRRRSRPESGILKKRCASADRPAGLVHVGLRLEDQHLLAADRRLGGLALEAPAARGRRCGRARSRPRP